MKKPTKKNIRMSEQDINKLVGTPKKNTHPVKRVSGKSLLNNNAAAIDNNLLYPTIKFKYIEEGIIVDDKVYYSHPPKEKWDPFLKGLIIIGIVGVITIAFVGWLGITKITP